MSKSKRRGVRQVVGFVVSLSGKKGGPYHQAFNGGKYRTTDAKSADNSCAYVRRMHPAARVLPVVRYELDREEERLRDAVVEACLVYASWTRALVATDALRAHLEKKR